MDTSSVDRIARRFSRLGDVCARYLGREVRIAAGPASGLRFNGGSDSHRFSSGDYERPVQEALVSLVKPGQVCYDIGANLGFFSLLCGRLVQPAGAVYAFEPVPRNARRIRRNARLNAFDHVIVLQVAVSREGGRGKLWLTRHVGGAVLSTVGMAPPDRVGSMTVETASLDDWVERHRIKPPNVVKIDVEGAELDVLKGMERLVRRWAPSFIVEVDDATEEACDANLRAAAGFLRDAGYRTRVLPNAYPGLKWFVRHFVAVRDGS